ncbi:MAG: superoxide dismutase [Bdellovibrionales bacterium RIFOXYD1_FULL_53_11]|nr:MAG: superoxide dismutase [Bdellovibrionales bacterium RIFOXYD1_FULL_53_11]
MIHKLPELPYQIGALAPKISKETLEFHYGKHHATYVTNLNKLISGTALENATLEEIIKTAQGPVFNNAAQVWNHTFFWNCMKPDGGGQPSGALKSAIEKDFGSFELFKDKFIQAAVGQFGSGWAWLVKSAEGRLVVDATSNAGNPMTSGKVPVMTCDVWEHAYYIDYRNNRAKFVETFWDLVNWDFVTKNL